MIQQWRQSQPQARLQPYPVQTLSMTQRISSPQTPFTQDSSTMYGDFASSLPLLANLASQLPRQPPISPASSTRPVDTNSSNGEFGTEKSRPVKPKRAQVKNACVHCQKACKKCSQERLARTVAPTRRTELTWCLQTVSKVYQGECHIAPLSSLVTQTMTSLST